jgi:cell division cycle 2-like protein
MMKRKRDRWDSSSEDENDETDPLVVVTTAKTTSMTTSSQKNDNSKESITRKNNNEDHSSLLNDTSKSYQVANKKIENQHQIVKTAIASTSIPHPPLHNPLLQGCRSVYNCYERLARLDEGTYGIVWKAKDVTTKEIVALKQIKFDPAITKDGFPIAALREIGVLLALSHECIVTVKEMVVGDDFDKVFMVMEYMEMDLSEAMKRSSNDPFPQAELKNMLYQILSATKHIHDKWILHRDLKTSNILVHKSGKIALCDFGLARKYQLPLKAMTQTVITLWYRPIELLFGESVYGPAVDMWSIGCIFGELLKKEAILQGQGELDQIDQIFKLIGAPDDISWPEFKSLPNSNLLRWKNKEGPKLQSTFPVNSFSGGQTYLDANGFDLLRGLLTLNPKKRLDAEQALNHPYFKEGVGRQTPRFIF